MAQRSQEPSNVEVSWISQEHVCPVQLNHGWTCRGAGVRMVRWVIQRDICLGQVVAQLWLREVGHEASGACSSHGVRRCCGEGCVYNACGGARRSGEDLGAGGGNLILLQLGNWTIWLHCTCLDGYCPSL